MQPNYNEIWESISLKPFILYIIFKLRLCIARKKVLLKIENKFSSETISQARFIYVILIFHQLDHPLLTGDPLFSMKYNWGLRPIK